MKLFRSKLLKRYREAHSAGREHIKERPYIALILGLLFGTAVIVGILLARPRATLRPSDLHVVFLTDNGTHQILDTKAPTVGELIKRLSLNLQPQDVVEPASNTPIVQDNFRINIYRARPVTIVDSSGNKIVTVTAARSPRTVAQAAGINIYPEDYVDFAPGDIKQNIIGEQVKIDRATPISMTLYGTALDERTHAATVGDLLAEKHIKLDSKDTLKPAASTPISANLAISIVRNGVSTVTVEQPIAAPTQYVSDSSLTFGATALRQAGSPGKQAITYQIDVEGGVEISRTVIQTTIVTPAVPQIVAVGTIVDIGGNKTSVMAAAGISSGDYGYVDYIVSHESGWCYTKAQGEGYCPAQPDNAYTSYGYGLCQATPGYKMGSAGADWATNPITQLHWCSGYAASRYGSWYAAYSHWLAYHNW